MTEDKGWRLDILRDVMRGETFALRAFKTPPDKPELDHEHCEACFQKIMDLDREGIDRRGYVTADGRSWICEACFADFSERFEWRVDESRSSWRDPRESGARTGSRARKPDRRGAFFSLCLTLLRSRTSVPWVGGGLGWIRCAGGMPRRLDSAFERPRTPGPYARALR